MQEEPLVFTSDYFLDICSTLIYTTYFHSCDRSIFIYIQVYSACVRKCVTDMQF